MKNEERDDPPECECCKAKAVPLTEYRPNVMGIHREPRLLCDLCAGTMTSTLDDYKHSRGDHVEIMKVVCFVGNEILKAIRQLQPPTPPEARPHDQKA
jgi:hypothetical protein